MSGDEKIEYSPGENKDGTNESQAGFAKSNKFLNVNPQFKNLFIHDETTDKKENYQIAICQDGKFVVTFDTGRCRSVVENNVCN